MPTFDGKCEACGVEAVDVFTWKDLPPCPNCGGTLVKLWRQGSFPNVIDDTYIGGLTVENLGPTPITFQSRSEHRDYLKANGFGQPVKHVGSPGSDKSPHTSRWI